MKIRLNDKVYDVLKWTCIIGIPAVCVLYSALSSIWGWGYVKEVCGTLAAIATFLGAIIGVSTITFNQEIEDLLMEDYIDENDTEFDEVEGLNPEE